jgi:hypothetical protein
MVDEIRVHYRAIYDVDIFTSSEVAIWVSGHSMGGALAEMFTVDIINGRLGFISETTNVITYTLGAATLGNEAYVRYAESIGASQRIFGAINQKDGIRDTLGHSATPSEHIIVPNITRFCDTSCTDWRRRSIPSYVPGLRALTTCRDNNHRLDRSYIPYLCSVICEHSNRNGGCFAQWESNFSQRN